MSPTRSNGRHSCCSHTGLNPLFLTTPVRHVTVRADVAAVVDPAVGGLYAVAGAVVVAVVGESVGRKGECVQSGMWIDPSTNGSMTDLSMISRPCESLGRGSCWAEMTCRLDAYSQFMGPKETCVKAHGDVEEVVSPLGKDLLVAGAESERLEHVSRPAVPLEHRMVDHVPQVCAPTTYVSIPPPGHPSHRECGTERTERLPIDRNEVTSSRPVSMGLVVRGTDTSALGISPDEVRPVVLDQVHHTRALLEQLVQRVLREREDVLRRILLLLVQPAALDANSVHQQRDEVHGHLHFGRLRRAWGWRRGGLGRGGAHAIQGTLGFLELGLEVWQK